MSGDEKKPYCIERRVFDPEILNITLMNMQRSIDEHARNTNEKILDIKASISVIVKDNKYKNEKLNEVDREFHICRAGKSGEDINSSKRNALLLSIITIVISVFACVFAGWGKIKAGN